MRKIVIALGGNAILSKDASAKAQQEAVNQTAKQLMTLIKRGNKMIISHGNGPQVGNLLLQQIAADSNKNPALPIDTLVAMTQGSIGYWLQNALEENLAKNKIVKDVISVITQVEVDPNDKAFKNPTKPIGPFYTEEEAKKEMEKSGAIFKEDAGRGWRKVVPSPKPKSIKEYKIIKRLIDEDVITIAAGGGGIPVKIEGNEIIGLEAVIDKDFASEKLAELVEADMLIILTGVDNVYVNYNKPNQKKLERVSADEMKKYIDENQFAPGSMLPKVEAAIKFVESKPGRKTMITSLDQLNNLVDIDDTVGTIVE